MLSTIFSSLIPRVIESHDAAFRTACQRVELLEAHSVLSTFSVFISNNTATQTWTSMANPSTGGSGAATGYGSTAPLSHPGTNAANANMEMKKRLFVVSHPEKISPAVLSDMFSRFGNLICFNYIIGRLINLIHYYGYYFVLLLQHNIT